VEEIDRHIGIGVDLIIYVSTGSAFLFDKYVRSVKGITSRDFMTIDLCAKN